MQGYDAVFAPLRAWIALRRGDMALVRQLIPTAMPPPTKNWWRLTMLAARLDCLTALADEARVEQEAAPLLAAGTLLEPWARRSLGVVRADERLLEEAATGFERMGLGWRAVRTREGDPRAW
jgi:hypothetical protein